MMDFSITIYRELCSAVERSGYKSITVYNALNLKKIKLQDKLFLLRHDVDRFPDFALRLAEIERCFGLRASYYFRIPSSFDERVIKEIAAMGHEVGLHYECVDKAAGNLEEAGEILKMELERFKEVADSHTVSMHGNPFSGFDNREIWNKFSFSDFGLSGEVYISIDFNRFLYYSDTGRSWDENKYTIKDKIPDTKPRIIRKPCIKNTEDLIELVQNDTRNLYILAHPSRWAGNSVQWLCSRICDGVINRGKLIFRFFSGNR